MARPTILIGPPVASMTKQAAEEQLKTRVAHGTEIEVQQHAGHWIAAYVEDKIEKTSAPFGGPADADEEAPAPKGDSGGGEDDGGDDSPVDDGPSDDAGEEGPPKKKKPGESGGLDAIVHQLADTVNAIAQALGVPPVGAGGMGPDMGADPMGGPPPGPGPAGPPAPPHAGHGGPPPPGGPAGPGNEHVIHEKSGPPPPATFAKVREQHPWGHMIGQSRFFTVAEKCGSDSYADVHDELHRIARAGGFRVARFTPLEGRQGERAVQAVIETPRAQ